jgi:DNA-binding response OmpR family regulator
MNPDLKDRRIVVCDSDRTVLELLQIRLDLAGCHTFVARTGDVALETIKAMRPHALLLELNLPEMDGFEVLRALNPRGEGIAFPVLVMGRKLAPADIQRAVGLGARDVLIKPFGGADVLERVARQFRRAAAPARPAGAVAQVARAASA